MGYNHTPILLRECIDALAVRPDGIYVDGTAGGGGHSAEIARLLTTGRLIAIDKDPSAVEAAGKRLAPFPCAAVVRGDFRDIPEILDSFKIPFADGVLLDLGVSSHQLDDAARGFSYHQDAPLDMRMGGEGISARDVVNTYSAQDLARILRNYGEERFAKRIANAVIREREKSPIETTAQLAELIKSAIPAAARREGGHPAKRSFQAIRIEVNGELDSLSGFMDTALAALSPKGRLAVITFHSLEDRIVSRHFAQWRKGCDCPPHFPVCVCGKQPKVKIISRKPVTPSQQEIEQNNRSRSAKLRVAEKI
ncbi:MAG: 16S rRNA (cytosine(1402)-N(4))-methyltransferase RsmH [Oscillospiraceae bacterium]|nr:16S rRNA (cytosine(1402)-N(4))-methyltransferase RsmH [Oscillospiraceae bacterium]